MNEVKQHFLKEISAFINKFDPETNEVNDEYWESVGKGIVSWSDKYKGTKYEAYTASIIKGVFEALEKLA